MASIGSEGTRGERKRILFRDGTGKQKTLRLGKCSQRAAEQALAGFERVLQAHRTGTTLHGDGVRWLESIDDRLHARVVALGLTEPREDVEAITLGAMLEAFFDSLDVKASTMTRLRQAESAMVGYFGVERDVASITEATAEAWRADLKAKGYATATISRTVVYARQVFRWGVRRGMASDNPFAELKAGSQVNPARSVYVDSATIEKVIDAAPDAEWRLLIALSRYGGLRVPSEALSLKWVDIDWSLNRMTVRSSKTEHHEGGGQRMVPIFPEIREHLQAVFDAAPEGAVYVVGRYRQGSNLNPQLRRIIQRAGFTPWPRTWHNLRASRQTELATRFPIHTVCSWIGNTRAIAAGHYLQVTDADWERAVTPGAASNAATQARARDATEQQPELATPDDCGALVSSVIGCDPVETGPVGGPGLEPRTPRV